jgi:hypothetical protein
MIDRALVDRRVAERFITRRRGALAARGRVERAIALEKKPISRIDRTGGEMRDAILVDVTP